VIVFYLLGYWYQKQAEDTKRETRRLTFAGLIVGVLLLVAGGIIGWIGGIFLTWVGWINGNFFLSLPPLSTGVVLIAAVVAITGFIISYAALAWYYARKGKSDLIL
jgi:hypothetical protein